MDQKLRPVRNAAFRFTRGLNVTNFSQTTIISTQLAYFYNTLLLYMYYIKLVQRLFKPQLLNSRLPQQIKGSFLR